MTTYELRNADPVALTGEIAGIVSACDSGAKITVHVSRDHGEHVAVVEVSKCCDERCEQGRLCPNRRVVE